MDEKNHKLIPTSSSIIKTINGVNFTAREIDLLACLQTGRSVKRIASFLSLSTRTVENYIYNIFQKINCNSREGIIDFLENSDRVTALKQHYSALLIRSIFEKKLNDISAQIRQRPPSFTIYYWQGNDECSALVQQFETHLKLAGMLDTVQSLKSMSPLDSFMEETSKSAEKHQLYVIPKALQTEIKNKQVENNLLISSLTFEECENSDSLIFLKDNTKNALTPFYFSATFSSVLMGSGNTYYHFFIKILRHFFPEIDFEDFLLKIQRHNGESGESIVSNSTQSQLPIQNTKSYFGNLKTEFFNILHQRKWQLRIFASVLLIILSTTFFGGSIFSIKRSPFQEASVRSDLPIPSKPTFLNRTDLIAEISNSFKDTPEIQTIAIIGPGGSGKTTLARQYARSQKSPIVWEINAENHNHLTRSFEELGQGLAQTDEEKKGFANVKAINNNLEKEKQIILFVKNLLIQNPNWFLIYNNVERFSDIQQYFPKDVATWGKGRVIITTRNKNLQNNQNINRAIIAGELTPNQKLDLFMRIMHRENDVPSSLKINEYKNFLKTIPPYPLDISVAAYFLKTTNLSSSSYLVHLRAHNKAFEEIQENIVNEMGEYKNTRYKIIAHSTKQIKGKNTNFLIYFMLLSLIDSQSIFNDMIIENELKDSWQNFILLLKEFSLISNEDHVNKLHTFSLHPVTHQLILNYLSEEEIISQKSDIISTAFHIFESYIDKVLKTKNIQKMRLLINHCNMFLSHENLLTNKMKASIESRLGDIYFYTGNYLKAQENLSKAITNLNQHDNNNYGRITKNLYNLAIIHREIGRYESAINLLEQSLQLHTMHLTSNFVGLVINLTYLGRVYLDLGQYSKAQRLLERSAVICNEHIPDNYNLSCQCNTYLSALFWTCGNYYKSKNLLEQNLEKYKNFSTDDNPDVLQTLTYLGIVYIELGNYLEAKKILKKSLNEHKKNHTEYNTKTSWIITYLANAHIGLGEYKKAKSLLENDLIYFKKYYPKDNIKIARHLRFLGNLFIKLRDYKKAKILLEESIHIYKNYVPKDHLWIFWTEEMLGIAYFMLGQFEKAQTILERTQLAYEKHYGKDHIRTAQILSSLADMYMLKGNLIQAEVLLNNSYTILQKNLHPDIYLVLESLANLSLMKAKLLKNKHNIQKVFEFHEQAHNYLNQAYEVVKSHFGNSSPHLFRIREKLSRSPILGEAVPIIWTGS